MQSWSLKKFVEDNGLVVTADIWGVSHQAVSGAARSNRAIQVTLIDGEYAIHETKKLNKGVNK